MPDSTSSFIYLASPYSHANQLVVAVRYEAALEMAAKLTGLGYVVFSPIVHSHPMTSQFGLQSDWNFWKKFDEVFVSQAAEVWVLCLPGWKESKGIESECELAYRLGKPVRFIEPDAEKGFKVNHVIKRGNEHEQTNEGS